MKKNSNSMLCGSVSNGIVVTDLPVDVLVAMRDSIDAAIRGQKPQSCDKANYAACSSKVYHEEPTKDSYANAIREAIASAEQAGYEICLNDAEWVNSNVDVQLYDNSEEDDDEYSPCEDCCRPSCRGCCLDEE